MLATAAAGSPLTTGGRPIQLDVRPAGEPDVRPAAEVIAAAFATLEASAWLVPDAAQREKTLARVFTLDVAHALGYGHVDLLTGRPLHSSTAAGVPATAPAVPTTEPQPPPVLGVAVWLDQTRAVPPPPHYQDRLHAAAGPHTPAFARLHQLFDQHHPETPHHHLVLFAVPPDLQHHGLGTVLLRHGLTRLDHATGGSVPVYLEAAGARSQPLYARHGFRTSGPPFALPNGATFQPMWRAPRRPRHPSPSPNRGTSPVRTAATRPGPGIGGDRHVDP